MPAACICADRHRAVLRAYANDRVWPSTDPWTGTGRYAYSATLPWSQHLPPIPWSRPRKSAFRAFPSWRAVRGDAVGEGRGDAARPQGEPAPACMAPAWAPSASPSGRVGQHGPHGWQLQAPGGSAPSPARAGGSTPLPSSPALMSVADGASRRSHNASHAQGVEDPLDKANDQRGAEPCEDPQCPQARHGSVRG